LTLCPAGTGKDNPANALFHRAMPVERISSLPLAHGFSGRMEVIARVQKRILRHRQITGKPVSAQQAQRALESLRERTPPLAWKSSRGEYAVEDAAMTKWFRSLIDAGRWPP